MAKIKRYGLYSRLLKNELAGDVFNQTIVTLSADDASVGLVNYKGEKIPAAQFTLEMEDHLPPKMGRGVDMYAPGDAIDTKNKSNGMRQIQDFLDNRKNKATILNVTDIKRGFGGVIEVDGWMHIIREERPSTPAAMPVPAQTKSGVKLFNLMWVDDQLDMIQAELDAESDNETINEAIVRLNDIRELINQYAEESFNSGGGI